jgi:HPt (histidine-containing phosphotransfer) domain-containing protein
MGETAALNDPEASAAQGRAGVDCGRPIDLVHLARSTLGDRSLEREVLALFERQAVILLQRMEGAEPATLAGLAHTLKGSARGIGAWRVAAAAEQVEAARHCDATARNALTTLAAHVAEATGFIRDLLRAH